MKKGTLVCLIVAVVLTVGGLLLCVLGWSMGGSLTKDGAIFSEGFPFLRRTAQIIQITAPITPGGTARQELPTQQPTAFVLETGGVAVALEPGDGFAVEAENVGWNSVVEDGVWKLQLAANASNGEVKITVPNGFAVQAVSISAGGSDVSLRGVTTADLQVELGAGKVQLENFICTGNAAFSVGAGKLTYTGTLEKDVTVDCGAGKVDLEAPRPESYGYAVSVGMGSVEIGGESYNGIADVTVRTQEHPLYTISVGMGKVDVVFTGNE